MNPSIEKISAMLAELQRTNFWGSFQVDFQSGQAVLIRKTETIRISDSNSQKGKTHEPRY